MTIKLAKDNLQREYLTIKVECGFTATQLAQFVLVEQGEYSDTNIDAILNIKSYYEINKKVKDCILDYGIESPSYSWYDNYIGDMSADECVDLVAKHIVALSNNNLSLA